VAAPPRSSEGPERHRGEWERIPLDAAVSGRRAWAISPSASPPPPILVFHQGRPQPSAIRLAGPDMRKPPAAMGHPPLTTRLGHEAWRWRPEAWRLAPSRLSSHLRQLTSPKERNLHVKCDSGGRCHPTVRSSLPPIVPPGKPEITHRNAQTAPLPSGGHHRRHTAGKAYCTDAG
jgi:hypothetical protein